MEFKCPACGAPCKPGEKFCQNCGTMLPEALPVEAPTEILQEVPAAPVYEAPAVPVQEAPAAPVYEAPAAPVQEAPAAPVYEASAAPVQEAPAAPVYEAPAAPVPPAAPVYTAPAAPAVPVYQAAPNYAPQQNVPNYAPKAAPVPPAAPQYAQPGYNAPAYAPAPAKPKKKKTGLIIGLCAGAAVLIAAAILLYFFVLSPSSITLSADTATVGYLDTIELTAEVGPGSALNKSVTWTSSDEDVATVWNGSVTGWSAGTCIITATTSNGKSASCTVTVEVAPSSVWLSDYWIDLTVGETHTLTPDIYPEDASDKSVTWTTSDSSVATVSNGVVTAVGEGNCEITATTYNGVSESCTVYVTDTTEPDTPTGPTEPVASSDYDKYILGDWRLTYVWDNEAYEDVPADQYGVSSKLTFNADHTASMTFNTDSTDELTWEFYYVDGDGDYMYGVDSEGDVMYCYYIVEYGELWFYIDDAILTYER